MLRPPPRRAIGGTWRPTRPVIIIAILAVVTVGIGLQSRFGHHLGETPAAISVRSADLVMQDHDDGSITVTQAGTGAFISTIAPETNGFLRTLLMGQVRERQREDMGSPTIPFHLTRWSDGRLTLTDAATHQLIELEAFGHTNAEAFARLLDLSPQPATR